VTEEGPYAWWKKAAMTNVLDDVDKLYRRDANTVSGFSPTSNDEDLISWCDSGAEKRIASVISIGDDNAEMQAVELAAIAHEHRRVCLRTSGDLISSPRHDPSSCKSAASRRSGFSGVDATSNAGSPTAQSNMGTPQVNSSPSKSIASRRSNSSMEGGNTSRASPGSMELLTEIGCTVKRLHNDGVDGAGAENRYKWPWIKRVKLQESPHVKQLITQLEEMVDLLPRAVAVRRNFRVALERHESDGGFDPAGECEPRSRAELHAKILQCDDVDLEIERKLRVQTV
jgi:hypothetical protein